MTDAFSISVLIPTHNRSKYAISTLRSLLSIRSDSLQIIVHDTSNDSCELKSFASGVDDPRLCYVHHPARLSMTDNHEASLRYAKGEYICLIGDDDTVLPSVIDAVEVARRERAKILVPLMSATYCWPDFRTLMLGHAHSGKAYLSRFTEKFERFKSFDALQHGFSNAFQGTDGMPKLYHGLVRRDLIEGIRRRDGRFFYGTSPDVSASISLSIASEYFYTWDYPVTLPGASGGSNTGRSALNKHKGDFKTDPHMAAFTNVEWDDVVPKFFSVETVWANAGWETLKNVGKESDLKDFNLNRLYALCFLKHREYWEKTNSAFEYALEQDYLSVSRAGMRREAVRALWEFASAKIVRLSKPNSSNGRAVLGTFENVFDAQRALVDHLDGKAS